MTWPSGSDKTAGRAKPDGKLVDVDPDVFTEVALLLRALSAPRRVPEQTMDFLQASQVEALRKPAGTPQR
jgi:hypothetical protein